MRLGVAIVLAGVAIAGAVYVGSARLNPHGYHDCTGISSGFGNNGPATCMAGTYGWRPNRGVWQVPVAIVIAAIGLGAAVVVARGT